MAIIITNLTPMPPGLTLLPNGEITGNPTAPFAGAVQIQATDGISTTVDILYINTAPPGVPVPSLTQLIEIEEISRCTISALGPIEIVPLFSSPTIAAITANPPISIVELSTPTIVSAVELIAELSTPFIVPIANGGFNPAIALPLGTAGLTQIVNYAIDDFNEAIGDIGFDLTLYGGNRRTTLFVCSNSFVTFSAGSSAYNSFSDTYPGMGLFVGAADRSWRSIWAGSDGPNSYRIRWEGYDGASTGPPANSFWEMTVFSDGAIMLVAGALGFSSGYSSITDGLGGNATPYTLISDSSWVFEPTVGGGFTVQTGSYSI